MMSLSDLHAFRCPSFSQLDAACVLRTNPADPCCLVPDCNPNYITPVPGGVVSGANPSLQPATGPSVTGTRPDIIIAPTAAPAIFTGTRPNINPNNPSMSGYSSEYRMLFYIWLAGLTGLTGLAGLAGLTFLYHAHHCLQHAHPYRQGVHVIIVCSC